MDQQTRDVINFIGVALDLVAIVWIWKDWQFSLYQTEDWRRHQKKSEQDAISSLNSYWQKFSKNGKLAMPNWATMSSEELRDFANRFPRSGIDEELRARLVGAVTQEFGIGPSLAELEAIRNSIVRLAVAKESLRVYREHMRRETYSWALMLLVAGLVLQLVGSWPSHWLTN